MGIRQPIFNAPWPVLLLLGLMVAVHLALTALGEEQGLWWLVALAFVPARYAGAAADLPGGTTASVTSFLTHMFVHGDYIHLAMNGAWLLAFGTPLAKRMGWWRMLLFTMACGLAGALTFLALHFGAMVPVVGASGAIAGLTGAVMRFLFPALDSRRGYLLREDPAAIPALPLLAALRDRRILIATASFVGLNMLAMIGLGSLTDAGRIAWEAHLGGYFFGFLCFGLFDIATRPQSPNYAERA